MGVMESSGQTSGQFFKFLCPNYQIKEGILRKNKISLEGEIVVNVGYILLDITSSGSVNQTT